MPVVMNFSQFSITHLKRISFLSENVKYKKKCNFLIRT